MRIIKAAVVWDVTPRTLVDRKQNSRETYCLLLLLRYLTMVWVCYISPSAA